MSIRILLCLPRIQWPMKTAVISTSTIIIVFHAFFMNVSSLQERVILSLIGQVPDVKFVWKLDWDYATFMEEKLWKGLK